MNFKKPNAINKYAFILQSQYNLCNKNERMIIIKNALQLLNMFIFFLSNKATVEINIKIKHITIIF